MPRCRWAIALLILLAGPVLADTRRGPGRDPAIARKVEALLGKMTLPEKIGQLHFPSHAFPRDEQLALVREGRIGAMLNVAHPDHVRRFREAAAASRLRVPLLFAIDAIYAFQITFPIPLAWAATWNPPLAERATEMIARETAAIGVNWTFAPMVDISRDPRWGRVMEGAGEDPVLAAAFSAARTRGYRKGGLATSVKHFIGYGTPEGGRDYAGAEISLAELSDRYLPPFKAALAAGSETVMASFNTVNGVPVTANRTLIDGLLKRKLGFDGIVTSDFVAIGELQNHGVAADLRAAALKAILAGIDFDMESNAYHRHLEDLVRSGAVPMAAIDDAVRRVLSVKFRLGLFDGRSAPDAPMPAAPPEALVRAAARAVARESFVLLKNDASILPLSPALGTIALIGKAAESTNDHSWYGPAGLAKPATETLKDALAARLRPGQTLSYAPAFEDPCGQRFADKAGAVEAARKADLVVLVVSEDCEVAGEGVSRTRLDLSGVQQELFEAIAATGRPLVLVVETGRPLTLSSADAEADAILVAWHPGTEGRTALAEVLVGEISPSGKLPMTFPRSVGQIPIAYDSLPTSRPPTGSRYTTGYVDEKPTPLYPFGHGLTYTDFTLSDLAPAKPALGRTGTIDVTVTVTNTGSRKGADVVQLYTRQKVASRSRPLKELKAFEKVQLVPAEQRVVRFRLRAEDLGFHDENGRLLVEPGEISLFAGLSSETTLESEIRIVGD